MNTQDNNISEKARKAIAEQRQQEEHRQELMHHRITEELDQLSEPWIEEQARELAARQRQHEVHEHDSLLSRTATEINLPMVPSEES